MMTTLLQQAETVGKLLKQLDLTIVTAESCTGGEIAYYITSVPGSSKWFKCGYVTYNNSAKKELLHVRKETLREYGSVSREAVIEMAKGALELSQADISIAVTGIAGPTGARPTKPVGTVWVGLGFRDNVTAKRFQFSGDRLQIRDQATAEAFSILHKFLLAYSNQ